MIMNESFVSFELAKRLKDNGFREMCLRYYDTEDDDRSFLYWNAHETTIACSFYHSWNTRCEGYRYIRFDAPTIAQVLKWLREEKNKCLNVFGHWQVVDSENEKVGFRYRYDVANTSNEKLMWNDEMFDSFEEAAIAGISFILDNLI